MKGIVLGDAAILFDRDEFFRGRYPVFGHRSARRGPLLKKRECSPLNDNAAAKVSIE